MIADCVIGGVDTHGTFHHAVVLDRIGRRLADKEFAANEAGYSSMLARIRSHGTLEVVGVEGT